MVVGESLFSLACNQPTELLISKSSPPESTLRRRCRGVVAVAKLLPCQSIAVESGVFPCCTLSRSLDESDRRCRRRRRVSTKLLRRRSFCQRGIWLPLPPRCCGDPPSSLPLAETCRCSCQGESRRRVTLAAPSRGGESQALLPR